MSTLCIAHDTCSRTVQIVANELGLNPELIQYDVLRKPTSNQGNFLEVNPLACIPALVLDNAQQDVLTEMVVIASYLADPQQDWSSDLSHGLQSGHRS